MGREGELGGCDCGVGLYTGAAAGFELVSQHS